MACCLVEESHHLSTGLLTARLLVVHDPLGGCDDDESEKTRGEKSSHPLFEFATGEVISRRDDSTLVESSVKFDDDLASAVVVDEFEFVDVSVLLHDGQKLHEHFADRSKEHLTLASLLRVTERL